MVTKKALREQFKSRKPISAVDFYYKLERWWGFDFNDLLIDAMVNASKKLDFKRRFVDDLPDIPPAVLRPAVAPREREDGYKRRVAATRLLLYAHEIVLDKTDLFLDAFNPDYRRGGDYSEILKQLVRIRPLVEDGSIKFTSMQVDSNPLTVADWLRSLKDRPEIAALVEAEKAEITAIFNSDRWRHEHGDDGDGFLATMVWQSLGGISTACELAANHRAHIMARDPADNAVIRGLLQRHVVDSNRLTLEKLASFRVPTMRGDLKEMVAVRKSDEAFHKWREHLGKAIDSILEFDVNKGSLDEVAKLVYDYLLTDLHDLEKALKKSPTLEAIQRGSIAFVVTGITGTASEVIADDFLTGLEAGGAGAAAAMLLEAGFKLVRGLEARRMGHLILDVAMMFNPENSLNN